MWQADIIRVVDSRIKTFWQQRAVVFRSRYVGQLTAISSWPRGTRGAQAHALPARSRHHAQSPRSRSAARCTGRAHGGGDAGAGRAPADAGAASGVVKGGHGDGPQSIDLLVSRRRAPASSPAAFPPATPTGLVAHLSSAIAAGLAKGMQLADAVRSAKDFVTAALAAADTISVGSGQGPLHHFHASWSKSLQQLKKRNRRSR